MIKLKLEADEQEVQNFIESIQTNPLVSDYDVNLNNVNDYALYIEEYKNCKRCKGIDYCKNEVVGHILKPDNGSFILHPCKFKKDINLKENTHSLVKTLFVSKRILNATLEQFELTTPNRRKIFDYIIEFIQNYKNKIFTKGLYIYGATFSTGKTFILGCIANELAKNKISCMFIYFPDLVAELKGNPSKYNEMINALKNVEVLLLDDFGSENMTPWLRDEVLGPVLNYRLMEEKPIFISSNIIPNDELTNHLSINQTPLEILKGSRIRSRLEGLVKPIELENASYKR